MKVFEGIRRRGLVFPLALLAALAMLLVSEGSHWRASQTLDALRAMAQAPSAPRTAPAAPTATIQSHVDEINLTLQLGRMGVLLLTAICLLALFLYLRHAAQAEAAQHELRQALQAEHDRLEATVAKRTSVLTELTSHLHTTREEERRRLARNLHDELGALLTAAKLDAARIRARLGDTAPEAQERLAHLVKTLNAGIALGRGIIEDLHPSTLDNLGLVAALEILVREFGERSGVTTHCSLAPVSLAPSAELVLYRLVQEAITNISKYAAARNVHITLADHDGQVLLSVEDDGVGFDPSLPVRSAYGLVGMRFRVEAERGRLTIVSAPGRGTRVQVSLPAAG